MLAMCFETNKKHDRSRALCLVCHLEVFVALQIVKIYKSGEDTN